MDQNIQETAESTCRVTGRRIAARARVALPGCIETMNGTVAAVLRNISTTGAMIEVARLPTVGTAAVLRCGPLDCFGTIVWARFRWCGFAFEELIPQDQVLRMRALTEEAARAPQRDIQDAARRWASGGSSR